MITIKKVDSNKALKAFVKFPFELYKNNDYWVPPIISQELKTFDKNENPAFKDAEATLFLAYKNAKIVGRIAAVINWLEVKKSNVKKMRFGWFDFYDDPAISKALIEEVIKIGKQHQLEYTEGPVGFSNMDKVGVITEGFNQLGSMITWYNHDYYAKHYINLGFEIEKEYSESKFPFTNVDPKTFVKASRIIEQRYKLKHLGFKTNKELLPYADKMFDLFNKSYASLSSFVEITPVQKAYFKKKFIGFVNPEYVHFVLDQNNELVGFAIVMPRFATALQKMKGQLFPFGFLKLLNAKKNSKDVVFYLIGIHPEYQNKGLTALIFKEYYRVFTEKGINMCYRTPELDNNEAIKKIWKHFNPEVYIRRKTFKKLL